MAITRATVALSHISGLAEDSVVNVWHLRHINPLTQTMVNKATAGLDQFYNSWNLWMGSTISRGAAAHNITYASVTPGAAGPDDDVVSAVLFLDQFDTPTDPAGGAINLPSEAAVCLSVRGNIEGLNEEASGGAIRPRARKRGRTFLGPLTTSWVDDDTNTAAARVASAVAAAVLDAYEDMIVIWNTAPDGLFHCVYSPTSATSADVESAWIDNAFDTIRSRGEKATFRETRPISQILV